MITMHIISKKVEDTLTVETPINTLNTTPYKSDQGGIFSGKKE